MSEQYNQYNHYINPHIGTRGGAVHSRDKIGTTDIKKAKQNLDQMTQNSAEDFARYEENLPQKSDNISASQENIGRETNRRRYSK